MSTPPATPPARPAGRAPPPAASPPPATALPPATEPAPPAPPAAAAERPDAVATLLWALAEANMAITAGAPGTAFDHRQLVCLAEAEARERGGARQAILQGWGMQRRWARSFEPVLQEAHSHYLDGKPPLEFRPSRRALDCVAADVRSFQLGLR